MNELSRFPDTETGGVLLGYSEGQKGVSILEATDGGYEDTLHEPFSFQYDSQYVAHMSMVLSELYTPPLDIVGVWHKHNSTSFVPFSRADEKIHEQLLWQNSHPCFSILFEKLEKSQPGREMYQMRLFELTGADPVEIRSEVVYCQPCL